MYGILASTQMMPSSWINTVAEKGFIAVLLIIFVGYFIRRSRNDDNRVKEAYATSQKNMEEQNRVVREREDYLLAESAKREEIIRTEAESREADPRRGRKAGKHPDGKPGQDVRDA